MDLTTKVILIFLFMFLGTLSLSMCYFIYRIFVGRNPTTTLLPIYILIISFVITQFIALFFMGITIAQFLCFLISIGTAFSLGMADLKRSRQTIGRF
mgnify:CR=1 FL=1